ncbi:MAG: hypothetical protein SVM80_12035 [Halobacteriota archaeon]|nr:hypothetical protein [Halobacteriota archaeon]
MSYPHRFYVYADSSLETSVKGILNTYAVEYSPLPNPAQTDILKYRCNHRDTKEIEAMDVALERLGAWLVYGRMPEEMVEFEEDQEYTFNEHLIFDHGYENDSWQDSVYYETPYPFTAHGFKIEAEWKATSPAIYSQWTYWVKLNGVDLVAMALLEHEYSLIMSATAVVPVGESQCDIIQYINFGEIGGIEMVMFTKGVIQGEGGTNLIEIDATYEQSEPSSKSQMYFKLSLISNERSYFIAQNQFL